MTEHEHNVNTLTTPYYERQNFKVGDKVMFVSLDDNIPFSHVMVGRVCKKTFHLNWCDGKYYGYVYKSHSARGTIVTMEHGELLSKAYVAMIKAHLKANNLE